MAEAAGVTAGAAIVTVAVGAVVVVTGAAAPLKIPAPLVAGAAVNVVVAGVAW